MPMREWSVRTTGAALFGLDWAQSGRDLYVTVSKRRGTTATYWLAANQITVFVTGATPGSRASGSSTNNSFPHSMPAATWVNTDVVNYQFTLPLGVSAVSVRVLSTQFHSPGWDGDHTESIPVTPQFDAPAAPTSVVATRVSDTQAGLAWSTNATSDAPYSSQVVLRSENGGTPVEVATLSGSATAYTASIVANRKYTFLVQARNTAGSTSSAASNVILTTPAKLASLTGAKVSGGIRLTLSKLDVPYTEAQVVLELTEDGGSTWTPVHTFDAVDLSTVAPTEWTDTAAPSGGTVQYRAIVQTNGGTQGALYSLVTVSNVMVLNVPPGAPSNLIPSGTVDVASPIVLRWDHTPSSDGAAQSSRQIQYSSDSGSTQTTIVTGDTTSQSYAWTVNTDDFSAGQTIQWRVRTAGSQPGTYGAWSPWQTITLRHSLTVNITGPSGTWIGGDIPVEWVATASWGSADQVAYRVVMASNSVVVFDSGTITSTSPSSVIPTSAQRNLTDYTITVTVVDNQGLASLPASTTISTDFLEPGPVTVEWVYDDNLGQLVFTPTFHPETSSSLDDTASWMLERTLDGSTWELIGTFDDDNPVADRLARVGAHSWYRTTGFTALDVAGEQTIVEIPEADVQSRWGRLSYGDGFEHTIRFGWSQTLEISAGRASNVYEVEGEDFGVAVFGRQKHRRHSVTGKLLFTASIGAGGIPEALRTSTVDEVVALGENSGICLFRDGRGAWWTCRVSDVKLGPRRKVAAGQPDEATMSLTIERVTA